MDNANRTKFWLYKTALLILCRVNLISKCFIFKLSVSFFKLKINYYFKIYHAMLTIGMSSLFKWGSTTLLCLLKEYFSYNCKQNA